MNRVPFKKIDQDEDNQIEIFMSKILFMFQVMILR